jgi:hypothetical protein
MRASILPFATNPSFERKILSISVTDTSPEATNVVLRAPPVSIVPAAVSAPKLPFRRTVSNTIPRPGSMWNRVERSDTIGSASGSWSVIFREPSEPV